MAWLELMVCAWTALTVQSLQVLTPRYSELGHNESLVSNCVRRQCQVAYWCRMRGGSEFQFLLSSNTANRPLYGPGLSKEKYTGNVQLGSSTSFALKIRQVDKRDTGVYFSILKNQSSYYLGTPVTLLKPGEKPPTSPPTTTTTTKKAKAPPSCSCPDKAKTKRVKGCDLTVWVSLGGTLLILSLVLLATLLYFSRLPKKCRHRFVRK
ncbi:hypothetical protein GJAV_G00049240 [Gymnothorax javanicus]|nr:hypothetical protein GJAV_G00049240 [Gymnothorax javanicus]